MKLLVTGASGFLGWNLCQRAAADWEVYGTYSTHAIAIPGITTLKLDLTDFQQVKEQFQQIQPDAVMHLAAQSSPNVCETQSDASYKINVTASCELAGLCADAEISFVFTSTDLVFDGLNAPYKETDPVSPVSRYGEQKAIAEEQILQRYPKAAICRMPLMFGLAPDHASSFLQPFIQTLRDGKELRLFVDEFRTPVSGKSAAQGLLLALEKVQGLIHLGGKERVSRYEFGQWMVEILELPASGIKASRQAEVKMAAPRPPDVCMDSSKAFALGYDPASIRESLAELKGLV